MSDRIDNLLSFSRSRLSPVLTFQSVSIWKRRALPVAGQHCGAVGFRLRGYRAGGVAGETALRDHPGQEGLVLAHHTGNTHGIICQKRQICDLDALESGKRKLKGLRTLFIVLISAAESVLRRLA